MTIWEQCNAMWAMPIDEVYAIEKKYYNYSNTDECELWQTAKKVVERHERRSAREAERKRKETEIGWAYAAAYKIQQGWIDNDRITQNGGSFLLDGMTFYVEHYGPAEKMTAAIYAADEKLKILLGDDENENTLV